MKCTLLQYLLVTDEEELLFRRDVRLEVVPSLHDDIYIPAVAVDGSLPVALGVRRCPHSRPSVLEDRVVVTLERMTHANKEQGPTEYRTEGGWRGWLAYYGFYETEQGDPLFMTKWSDKVQHVVEMPDHPSPCCGYESGKTGQIGTAFIFTCGVCGQKWHYAGGKQIAGLPQQQEPGVRLADVLSPLDPTDQTRSMDGGTMTVAGRLVKRDPDMVPVFIPPHKCCCPAIPCPVHKDRPTKRP